MKTAHFGADEPNTVQTYVRCENCLGRKSRLVLRGAKFPDKLTGSEKSGLRSPFRLLPGSLGITDGLSKFQRPYPGNERDACESKRCGTGNPPPWERN